MQRRKSVYISLSLLLAAALIFGVIADSSSESEKLQVVFLDVGQGDAILISSGSNQVLIDGGASGKLLLEKLGGYIPFWDRQIETVIVTHPDKDHIGGLIGVLETYDVAAIMETESGSDSQVYKTWKDSVLWFLPPFRKALEHNQIPYKNHAPYQFFELLDRETEMLFFSNETSLSIKIKQLPRKIQKIGFISVLTWIF